MGTPPRVAVIVVAWNHLATTTAPCLASVRAFTGVPYRVLCVDNGSTDGTRAHVERLCARDDRFTLVARERNLGWADGALAALDVLRPDEDHVCLLNSDTIVVPGWLARLMGHLHGAGEPTAVIPDETPDLAGPARRAARALGAHLAASLRRRPRAAAFVPGSRPPAPSRSRGDVLALARRVHLARDGASAPSAPSGFCLLTRRSAEPLLRAYLGDFERYRTGALDWRALWEQAGATCRVALDTHVFHARGGSGAYYAY